MKKLALSSLGSMALITAILISFETEYVEARAVDHRHFFQITSTYDDGAMTRWTGCVNIGGMCWSESSVVADCSFDGGETWTDCNRNDSLSPGN